MFIVVRGIQRKWDSRSFNTSDSGDTTIKCRTELCFMKNDAVADCAVFSCNHFCSINPFMQLLSKLTNWQNYLEFCYNFFFLRCLMAIWFRHCDAQSRPHFRKIRNFFFWIELDPGSYRKSNSVLCEGGPQTEMRAQYSIFSIFDFCVLCNLLIFTWLGVIRLSLDHSQFICNVMGKSWKCTLKVCVSLI